MWTFVDSDLRQYGHSSTVNNLVDHFNAEINPYLLSKITKKVDQFVYCRPMSTCRTKSTNVHIDEGPHRRRSTSMKVHIDEGPH